jgi:hypothetical protein
MRLRTVATLLAVGLAAPAAAQDGTIKVFDASLNEFANKLQPITVNGRHRFSVPTPFGEVTLCDSPYVVRVRQLGFATTPANVQITAQVEGTWCNLSVSAPLNTTANVSYNAGQRSIIVTVNPTSVQPMLTLWIFVVPLPVRIDVSSMLKIPPFPLGLAQLSLQGVHGPATLRFEPQNVSVFLRNGFLELQSDFTIW